MQIIYNILNKFSSVVFDFMFEMYLRQLIFTSSTRGPLTKNKERIKKI